MEETELEPEEITRIEAPNPTPEAQRLATELFIPKNQLNLIAIGFIVMTVIAFAAGYLLGSV